MVTLLKQAPIDVAMESLESNYPPGAEVAGKQWQSVFSELRVMLTNQSNDIYSDIDILVRTDLTIPEVGIIARFGQCVAEPVKVLEADVHWESGGKKGDLRHGMKGSQDLLAPVHQIHCDRLFSQDRMEIVLPLVKYDLKRPKEQTAPRTKPSWATIIIKYQGNGRGRTSGLTLTLVSRV